jgi:hypothetical protein
MQRQAKEPPNRRTVRLSDQPFQEKIPEFAQQNFIKSLFF